MNEKGYVNFWNGEGLCMLLEYTYTVPSHSILS